MTSFSCHTLLDQSVTIFQNFFLYFSVRLMKLCSLQFILSFFFFSFFTPVQVFSPLFHFTCLRQRLFVSFSSSLESFRHFCFLYIQPSFTMMQPYFTPQFLSTMFSFVLVCAKRSSLQCFSTFLRVLRSPLTQQFSLAVTM